MKRNIIDSVIRTFSPMKGLEREQARMALQFLDKEKQRSFDGAGRGSRHSGWRRPGTSADSAIINNLPLLRNGSRDLTRNNSWASKSISIIENNTVGTGILPQIVCKKEQQRDKFAKLLKDWSETTACDFEGRHDLVGLECLAIRTIVESGEVLIRRRSRRISKNNPIPFQLQILEPDHLDSRKDGSLNNGGYIKSGIEYSKKHKVVAYWLLEEHPGGERVFKSSIKSFRIGKSQVIHAFDTKRAGQGRGYPWCASAIRKMKDFDDFEDAQLVRQKIAACFAVFIHDANAQNPGKTGLEKTGADEEQLEYVQPGIIEHLPTGKSVTFGAPPGVTNYGEYSRGILLGIASAYGISYEALTGDFTQTNFSSGRMGHIEMGRNLSRWQKQIMKVQILDVIMEWFMLGTILAGHDNEHVCVKWVYPRREMIDPTKEVPAKIKEIRAGLNSLPRALQSQGLDPEEIISEIKESNDVLDASDIVLDSDPRHTNGSGCSRQTQNDTTPEDKDKTKKKKKSDE